MSIQIRENQEQTAESPLEIVFKDSDGNDAAACPLVTDKAKWIFLVLQTGSLAMTVKVGAVLNLENNYEMVISKTNVLLIHASNIDEPVWSLFPVDNEEEKIEEIVAVLDSLRKFLKDYISS